MAKLAAYPEPMNVAQFLAFNATRPDGEKWELLDGELFLNASPVRPHQIIVANLMAALRIQLRGAGRLHEAIPGIGVQLSDVGSVQPDVLIRPRDELRGNVCDDVVVAFDVLSPSTRRNDLEFKRLGYAGLASLTHYVVVAPERVEVRVFSRLQDWAEHRLTRLQDAIAFDPPAAVLTLAEIYDDLNDLLETPKP